MTQPPPAGPPSSSAEEEGGGGFVPPQQAYDADRVASSARERDPGLPEETARELAVYAWEHLRAVGEPDAPEIARRLLADHPQAGATAANVVALAAVAFCQENGVELV